VGIAALLLFCNAVAAQTIVTGTGDPDVDVAAVQSAVDRGGSIVLKGHFSFDIPPTMHGRLPGLMAMILVSKPTTISGSIDDRGEMTAIKGGEIPFAVEASGAEVKIAGLRFVRPKRSAIFANLLNGLVIESCVIEDVEPLPPPSNATGMTLGIGIHVSSVIDLPTPNRPGNPADVSGQVAITNNQISVGEQADHGVGIMVVGVGDSGKPVEVDISRNTVRNANEEGIDVKYIRGRVRIDNNTVTSSTVYSGPARGPVVAIHSMGLGTYTITHNRIEIADPNGTGIRARGYTGSEGVIERVISDNDVTISAPEGSVFGGRSAGIDVRGFARDNIVKGNRIRGRARVGLSLARDGTVPAGYTYDQNDQEGFTSSDIDQGKRR
jgi:hypothetical protein